MTEETKGWTTYLEVDADTEETVNAIASNPDAAMLLESLISTWIAAKNKLEQADVYIKTQAGDREQVRLMLARTLIDAQPDPTRWEVMPKSMKYDEYLINRRAAGKLTKLDLTRAGLKRASFSSDLSYHSHCQRVQSVRPSAPMSGVVKQCRECGQTLPKEKFGSGKTKGQGLVCNACVQRIKRERKKAEKTAEIESDELEKGYAEWLAEKEAKDAATD